MRVNVDSKVLGDPRFRRLAHALGNSWREALGICVVLWLQAYENRSAEFAIGDVDLVVERDGFAAAFIASGLADDLGDGRMRVRGVKDRIAFLEQQKERGRRGGRTSGSRRREADAKPEAEANGQGALEPSPVPVHDHLHDQTRRQSFALAREGGAPAREPKAAGTALPDAWKPNKAAREVANSLDLDVDWEADKFRDHALAKGKRSADWHADFRFWLRNAPGFNGGT